METKILRKIELLQLQLYKTDYVDNKLAQAIKSYILTGDKTPVIAIEQEYGKDFAQRQAWRDEINLLEEQLKTLQKE